ncbi:MAG: permease [Carboxylicivirga sp.]|nr:permease [Carboxylicivirga sp.]
MHLIYIITILLLIISLSKDAHRTKMGIIIGFKKFIKILPAFSIMVILSSIAIYLLPEDVISTLLNNDNKIISLSLAAFLGSILILPGFIAFPLGGFLIQKGITFMVISAFTTTLMMVGLLTFPIEKQYFGSKSTILRNTFSFCIAIIIALVTGIIFNEIELL